jgi:hypothetical protein
MLQAVPLLEHLQVSPQALPEQQVQGGGRVGVQTDVTSVVTNVGPSTNTGVSVPPVNVAPIGVGTERRDNVVAAPDNTNTSAISNTQDLTTTAPELPQRGGREAENTQTEPNTPAPQPDAASNTNTVTPSPNASGRGPNNQTTRPGTNDQSGNPMLIPDSALNSGSTRFLDGSWSAGAGIQDAATGKPVRLEYDFSQGNGQGRVTVRRGDGVQCTGSVGAQMQGRTVQINDRGTAKCTDGSTMALPKVTCTPGVGNQAACQGQYDNGTSFPVSMRHAPK